MTQINTLGCIARFHYRLGLIIGEPGYFVKGNDLESAREKSAKRMGRTGSAGKGRHSSARHGRRAPAKKIPDLAGAAVQDFAGSSALLGLDKGHEATMEDASIEAPPPDAPQDACVDIQPLDNEAVDE